MVALDSGARFLVSERGEVEGLDHLINVSLDQVEAKPPSNWARRQTPPETPAYIIYTSGTSGRPKGVVVSRSNLASSNAARLAFYSERPSAFLLLSSLAFDSSVAGLFWTLSSGGKLVIAEHRLEQDVERLASRIEACGVTHLLCLPALYAVLIEHADRQRLASLTHAIVAGEACPPLLPTRHRETLPNTRLINEYGPTEATVWCLAADITGSPATSAPTIGRPIPGARIELVDHRDRRAPQGAAGELVISGPGVALGYHRQPGMTKASFAPLGADGGRFYRTGDYARWREDGGLGYLGRQDDQIKIRGHRIEIADVEAALEQAPGVTMAAVAVAKSERHTADLIAFVEGQDIETDRIRRDLENRLPAAMLPNKINVLSSLPRLPNGKADRKALLALALVDADQRKAEQYLPPANTAERKLIEIWKKVLKVNQLGIRDDFFALGGNSLASIKIVSLARREGLEVKPTSVLEFPTIEALARSMERSAETNKALVASTARLFFMVHGGGRMRGYLQSAFGDRYSVHQFDDHWDDGCLDPRTSVMGMAEQYLAELRSISPKGPYLLGGYSIGAAVSVVMARRLMDAGEDVELLFLLDPLHRIEFFAGVEGLDPATLPIGKPAIVSKDRAQGAKHHLSQHFTAASDALFKIYTRYLRGPSRLLRGALAYYLRRQLSPTIASHYAWIVYTLAIKKHKLSPYPGRLLVFRSTFDCNSDDDYLWEKLAKGDYAEERFACEHLAFRRNPDIVKTWTERLADHLHRLT